MRRELWAAVFAATFVLSACSGRTVATGKSDSAGTGGDPSAGTDGGTGGNPSIGAGGTGAGMPTATGGSTSAGHIDYGGAYPKPPVECGADGSCPTGLTCFHLTAEIGVCDDPAPPATTECTPKEKLDTPPFEAQSMDECACNGASCGEGQICHFIEATCSCPTAGHNVCVDTPCTSPADCPDGMVCRPSSYILASGERCIARSCTGDADCTDGAEHGRCMLSLKVPSQAGEVHIDSIRCHY
jgi:hypothetical protein